MAIIQYLLSLNFVNNGKLKDWVSN